MCLRCRVSAISAFCRPTTPTPSINNCLVAIVHTKPVNSNFSPQIGCHGNVPQHLWTPSNTRFLRSIRAHNPPKQHLDRFSCFCTDDRRVSLYFTIAWTPPKLTLPNQSINQSKPICNAPISPSKKTESEAREATVTGSDQRTRCKIVAFKIAFKTIDSSCRTTVKRQVIRDLWRTNRKCLVRHDQGRVRTAKQQFVRRSQRMKWHRVTNERCQI